MLRWKVETDYRKFKYDILYNNIRSKTKIQLMIDIKILNFIAILTGQLENSCKVKKGSKINTKNTTEMIYTDLLKIIMYKNMTKEFLSKIYTIIGIISTTVELIRKNRYHKRRRISPSTKWNINGNRYG
jgi:glycerol-3-phosphate responsive antiterminator